MNATQPSGSGGRQRSIKYVSYKTFIFNISAYFWCICSLLHLPVISSFLWICSHSLIPSTSCLRINYISIDWPLGRGIDIHRPPSAPRQMCIPQHRSKALCITPGLHYALYFSLEKRSSHGRRSLSVDRDTFTHRLRTRASKKIQASVGYLQVWMLSLLYLVT